MKLRILDLEDGEYYYCRHSSALQQTVNYYNSFGNIVRDLSWFEDWMKIAQ